MTTKSTARKITKALIQDVGGIVHLGNTLAELYESLVGKQERDILLRFSDSFSGLLVVLNKIFLWKNTHESFSSLITDFDPFHQMIIKHHENEFRTCHDDELQRLTVAWEVTYTNKLDTPIQSFTNNLMPKEAPISSDTIQPEEVSDLEIHINALENINTSMKAAFKSKANDKYKEMIPNVCFEFRRAINHILARSNDLLIEYINSVEDDIKELTVRLDAMGD